VKFSGKDIVQKVKQKNVKQRKNPDMIRVCSKILPIFVHYSTQLIYILYIIIFSDDN